MGGPTIQVSDLDELGRVRSAVEIRASVCQPDCSRWPDAQVETRCKDDDDGQPKGAIAMSLRSREGVGRSAEGKVAAGASQQSVPQTRHVGPFSGGQLTAIIISLVVMIGFPAGAFAVTRATAVTITSPSGIHAIVDPTGGLQVAGPPPSSGFTADFDLHTISTNCGVMTTPPGKALVITSIDEVPMGTVASSQDVFIYVWAGPTSDCTSPQYAIAADMFGSDTPHQVTYSPGIGIKTGHYLRMHVDGPTNSSGSVIIHGYTVPASECSPATIPLQTAPVGFGYVGCF